MSFAKDGEDAYGYRIRVMGSAAEATVLYVVREDGKYRILGSLPDAPEAIGALVLDLLEKNDIKGAQWWLDKVAGDVEARNNGTGLPALRLLWSGMVPETRGPKAIRTAAAAMIGMSTGDSKAIRTLEQARLSAPAPLEKGQIDKALCESLMSARKWTEMAVVAARLATVKTFSEEGFRYSLIALTAAGKWKELEAVAQKRFAENDKNLTALQALVSAKARQGDYTAASQWAKKMTDAQFAGPDEYMLSAWNAMLAGKADKGAADALKDKVKDRLGALPDYQYTLAIMQTLLKMPDEAQQSLLLGLAHADYFRLSPLAWIAYGRICDLYGFPDEAEAALNRARETTRQDNPWLPWALLLAKAGRTSE